VYDYFIEHPFHSYPAFFSRLSGDFILIKLYEYHRVYDCTLMSLRQAGVYFSDILRVCAWGPEAGTGTHYRKVVYANMHRVSCRNIMEFFFPVGLTRTPNEMLYFISNSDL
jgi:hypothetical protein